ncbi:MAG: site-specific integrase, partial [Spirochaetales bacterium]|nr:site-specific integrase [Spirochaetales bacterium]
MNMAGKENERLSEAELERLFRAPDLDTVVGIRNVTIMLLMVECGLKVGEIVGKEGASGAAVIGGLRIGDVALSERRLTVVKPKRGTTRGVDLSLRVTQYLTVWLSVRP